MSLSYDSDSPGYELGYDTESLPGPFSQSERIAQHSPEEGPRVSYWMNLRIGREEKAPPPDVPEDPPPRPAPQADDDGAPDITRDDVAGSTPPVNPSRPSTTTQPSAVGGNGAGGASGGTGDPATTGTPGASATGGGSTTGAGGVTNPAPGETPGASAVDPKALSGVENGTGTEGGKKARGKGGRKKKKEDKLPPREPINPSVYSTAFEVAGAHYEYLNVLTAEREVLKKKGASPTKEPGLTADEASVYLRLNPPPDLKDAKYSSLGPKEGNNLYNEDKRAYLDEIKTKPAKELRQEIANMQVAKLLEKYRKDGVDPKVAFDRLKAQGYLPDLARLGWDEWPTDPIKANHYVPKPGETGSFTAAPKAQEGLEAVPVQRHLENLQKTTIKFDKAEDAEELRQTMARESVIRVTKDRWTNPKGPFQYTEEEANGILVNLGLLKEREGAYEVTDFDPERWTDELLEGLPGMDLLVDHSESDPDDLRYMVEDLPAIKAKKFFYKKGEEIRPDTPPPEISQEELHSLSPVAQAIVKYAKDQQAQPRGAELEPETTSGPSVGEQQGGTVSGAAEASPYTVGTQATKVAGVGFSTDEEPRTVLQIMQSRMAERQQRREDRRAVALGDNIHSPAAKRGKRPTAFGGVVRSRVGRLFNRGLSRDFYDPQIYRDAENMVRPFVDRIFHRFGMNPEEFKNGVPNPSWALEGASYQEEAADPQQQSLLAGERTALVATGAMDEAEATRWQRAHPKRTDEEISFNTQTLSTEGAERVEFLKQENVKRQESLEKEAVRMEEMGFSDADIAEYQRQHVSRNLDEIKYSFPVRAIPSDQHDEVVQQTRDKMRAQMIADAAKILKDSGVRAPEAVATNLYSQHVELGALDEGAPVDELVEHRAEVEEDLRLLQDDPDLQEGRAAQFQREAAATKTDEYLDALEAKVKDDPKLKKFYTPENAMLFAHQNSVQLDDPAAWESFISDLENGDLDKEVEDFPSKRAAQPNSEARRSYQQAKAQAQDMPDFDLLDPKERDKEKFAWQKEQQGNRMNEKRELRQRKWQVEDARRQENQQKFQAYQGAMQQYTQPLVQQELQKRFQDHSVGMQNMFQLMQSKSAEIDKLVASQIQVTQGRTDAILQAMMQVQQTILQGLSGAGNRMG